MISCTLNKSAGDNLMRLKRTQVEEQLTGIISKL